MGRRAAKELPHIQGWLDRVEQIVERGEEARDLLDVDVLLRSVSTPRQMSA
jgi:hypothetical protein